MLPKSVIRVLLFCLSLSLGLTVSAQNVKFEAQRILAQHGCGSVDWLNCPFDQVREESGILIVENTSPPAFVALQPLAYGYALVGYSCSNLFFTEKEDSPLAIDWIQGMTEAASQMKSISTGLPNGISPVTTLLPSQWSQNKKFSWACPRDKRVPGGHAYPGCVAVAMGQIIRYYRDYNDYDLQMNYSHPIYGSQSATLGGENWDKMDDLPVTIDREISEFLYGLGVLVHMDYGNQGSSANSYMTLQGFHQLGYEDATINRAYEMDQDAWLNLFYQNLSEFHPIFVAGGGHAFVCDGMDADGYFHFNMGGAGYGDGYYTYLLAFGYPVSEVITGLYPSGLPTASWKPVDLVNGKNSCSFRIESIKPDRVADRYFVYVDEHLVSESTDAFIQLSDLPPGWHRLQVSGRIGEEESTWSGPIPFFCRGEKVSFADPNLERAIRKALGYDPPEVENSTYLAGDLADIRTLKIDQVVYKLNGIEFCTGLRSLVIDFPYSEPLDLSPVMELSELRVLKVTGFPIEGVSSLGRFDHLVELTWGDGVPDFAWFPNPEEFLALSLHGSLNWDTVNFAGFTQLEQLTLRGGKIVRGDFLIEQQQINYLNLSRIELGDLVQIHWPGKVETLILSNNSITDMTGITRLRNLRILDLSHNQISELKLFDAYKSLEMLDVSDNQISNILVSADLEQLQSLDLSRNLLISPGRLFLYTPELKALNISHNRLLDMSKYRCQKLEKLYATDNQLTYLNWWIDHPELKVLDLSGNQISDFQPLITEEGFNMLDTLRLVRNPMSEQSYREIVPELKKWNVWLEVPLSYEPLSPCYVSPGTGNFIGGGQVSFTWFNRNQDPGIRYEFKVYDGDTIQLYIPDIKERKLSIVVDPGDRFEWQVGTRTEDSIFWSGLYHVKAYDPFAVPFIEDFEAYGENQVWSCLSPFWSYGGAAVHGLNGLYPITDATFTRSGKRSLRFDQQTSSVLDMSHLDEPALNIRFSIMVPQKKSGNWWFTLKDGLEILVEINESNQGNLYLNDRLYGTFTMSHDQWMDWRISLNANNDHFFVVMNNKILMNQIWIFSSSSLRCDGLTISAIPHNVGDANPPCLLYLDDVMITLPGGSNGIEDVDVSDNVKIFPNPVLDYYTVDTGAYEGQGWIRVYRMDGALVDEIRVQARPGDTIQGDAHRWGRGIYIVSIELGNKVRNYKIIK